MLRLTPPIVFLLTLLVGFVVFNTYTIFQVKNDFNQPVVTFNTPLPEQRLSMMSFSEFDKQKAREFMDKDNDGRCDACGMPIDQCIAGGMMQCSMDTTATLGVLGSQHIHADFKLFIDDKQFDFSSFSHMQRMKEQKSVSSFIHVDSGAPEPEKIGDVLHMHATGVPLSLFFESIGINFDKNLKLFVNGKENKEGNKYVFKDLDKILITNGKGNIQEQLKSITDFAKVH